MDLYKIPYFAGFAGLYTVKSVFSLVAAKVSSIDKYKPGATLLEQFALKHSKISLIAANRSVGHRFGSSLVSLLSNDKCSTRNANRFLAIVPPKK